MKLVTGLLIVIILNYVAQIKNPFSLDSKEPTGNFQEFIQGEVRYTSLKRAFPEIADELFAKTEKDAKERLEGYKKLAGK